MRRDYHYYAIYIICIWAGIKPQIAEMLAYASEQVDDAKLQGPLKILDGGQYWPISSAHPIMHPDFFQPKTALNLYAPFHFFPSLSGLDFDSRMCCLPESEGILALKRHVLRSLHFEYGQYYLGIALHIIADSYAHQGFSAIKSECNEVNHLKINTSGLLDIVLPPAGTLFPPIAHLQATTCPDEPACIWTYFTKSGTLQYANNLERYLEASKTIYHWLSLDVRKVRPDLYNSEPQDFSTLAKPLSNMLNLNMLLKDRLLVWERALEHTYFGDIKSVRYNADYWKDQAIEVHKRKHGEGYFISLNIDFQHSHWHLFNIALVEHLNFFFFLLFPRYQIYI